MKKFFGKLGKKKGEPGRPTPPPSPNLSNLGAIGAAGGFYVGYEVREKDLPKLHKAVWNDDLVKVKSLVKKDVNGLDKENRTPLHLACVKGNKPVVQELLEWHAKPNIGDNEGKTPLLKAVECKKEDCVMLLLQHTADVDTRDRLGDTAVHVAVKNSFTNILRLLIKSGADINIKNKNGFAPLHLAVKNKKDEVTKILLQNRADFDVMDADGRTPLMYACYEGAITQVKDLITVGADTQIKDTKGFNAEDIANQKGQHACSHLLIEHNNKQSGSVASTPRMPSISSRTTTPRQENNSDLMFGLPATNMANDYDSDEDGTFSKSAGDDSWKSDADMSLSLHGKRTGGFKLPSPTLDDTDEEVEMPRDEGATPKVNLAKALNRLSTGSDASDNEALRSCLRKNSSFSDKEGDSHSEGHDIPVKRLSAKSIQSVTSAEIEWSDEDENSPVNTPRKSSSSKVSFIDKDVSEIHEITATESETDDGGEYQGSEAKRPKYDNTFQQQQNTGYTPTGLTGVANDELSQQKMKVENEYANGTDFMKDIGLDDDDVDDFTSTPDISEMSEPIETAPKPPENQRAQSKQHDSDWDSTEPGVTPRTQKSILKTSNRQNEGEAQQQIQQKKQPLSPRSDEETSEWDSDVEDMLDPKKSGGSNWDSSNDAATPRGPPSRLTTSAIVVGIDEDEDDEDFDEEAEVPEQVPVQQEVVEKQQQEVIEQTVDALNHTGGSHISYVTTESHSSKNTVIKVTKEQAQDQPEDVDDEDSEWDSDEDIDCVDNVSPPIGVSPIVRGSEFSVEEEEDEEDEESVSEWEVERLREKERKQKLEEEAERRREEELERQREAERLVEQEEWEELQRQEQLRREEEEEALRQKLEEEEALKRKKEEDAQRQRMEEEAQRQQLEEAHRQQVEQEAHRQQLEQESHRKQLEQEAHKQQLEEEAQRQEEEKQKKEQMQKNGSDKLTKKNSFKDEENSSPRRIYKANVTLNKTQQKEGINAKPVVEESLEKTDDLMSFTAPVSAPVVKETASAVQSSYTAPPIVEETIQKEDKSRSYTQMKGQVEEGITSFSSRQPVKTTNTKRDVEKSLDPSKEQKRRPMSVESIDITADDDDESVDMDHVGDPERQDMGSYLRTLPSSYSAYKYNGIFDDDLISLTSTEVDDSMAYPSNTPYGKDILANMNLSDPGTVLKLQDHMHEQNKRLDHERNARITTENKYKSLLKEKNVLQKKSDGLNQQRANLEQEKLDLETRIRNLDYKLSEESEMRKNAETLLSKTKEQLNKKEEQYTCEIEAKQAAELQMRNLQMELRSANNSIKQLEEEKDEYQQQVQHEKNARQMQEQINEEQHRLHEQLTFKQAEIASKQFDAENQLEVADEDRKHAHDSLSILRAELTALKTELEKERKRRRDEASMMSGESEELQGRIEDLKNENKMTEDALTKATMAHSLQVSNLNTEITIINSQYEKERASKEKVDAELESLKTRLQSSSWEVDKAEQARSEVERRLQYEKEEWTKQLESSQKDNTLLKDQQQTLLHRLSSLESKLNSVENELHVVNTSLLERTNQLQQCQKDLEYYKSAQDNYDQNYKLEKELNSKLQTKVESLQEKVTGFQHENLTLKQQLESLQHVLSDRSGEDAHEKFTSMLASLKSENEKARLNMEERNSSLSEQVTRLKDENRSLEGRRGNLEQDNQRLNREYTDMFKKLSVAEASHEVSSKAKEHLESEKHKLAMDLERTQQKYETAQQKCLELQTRVTEVTEHVKKAENVRDQARAELLNTSVNQDEGNKIRQDLEGTLHHIQIDNARLDAELKHERQRVEQLQKDLQDSQKVRNSLESLCSNLKSANNMLEDKREHVQSDNSMDDEVSTRVLLTQEAEENKELWEKEVISRSKLGLRVSQYEKQRQEALSHLEEERRKARKATEKVKVAETKLEVEQEKNIELQKELATMKGYLKMAKRKLKVLDSSDSRVNTITTEFDKERLTMEGTLSEARQQIASLQQTVESEVDEKEKLHSKNVQLQTKIASLKHLEKNVDKLEKSKYRLEEDYKMYKAKMENGYVNKDELNQKEKELEAHYRLQLNRKLDEINNYLEQQARARERLDNSRDETEYKIKDARRKLEDENTSLKIQNEQIKAQKDSKEMEAKRFRDLYDSEMQWRMRLSEQLVRTTDKAYGYKSKLVAERQRGRIQNNLSFSTPVNGNAMDYSRLSMNGDDILSNRLRVELDRSIAKHLEAAPHDNIQPAIRTHDDSIMNSSFAKSSAEYLELLKRKYCV
ncbi:ankyrin repeat domain-containing protein 26-like isoform X18 [Mytilus trossulus]|uniref:ankyrin repeat domain-containing protein 26-like isoform X18 n=1 Tax=Mytilus trossulus TaxID=6551 RepID=UPI00300688B0